MSVLLTKNQLLENTLVSYYDAHKDHLDDMMKIINGQSKLSLRIIEWFVKNYAMKYYTIIESPFDKRFKVYNEYKLDLDSFQKKNFDPCCRNKHIQIAYDVAKGEFIETTIGQLNFFRWIFTNNIISYIEEHYAEILADMKAHSVTQKFRLVDNAKTSKVRKPRKAVTFSAYKSIQKEHVNVTITFD